jgi:hypothetical protein
LHGHVRWHLRHRLLGDQQPGHSGFAAILRTTNGKYTGRGPNYGTTSRTDSPAVAGASIRCGGVDIPSMVPELVCGRDTAMPNEHAPAGIRATARAGRLCCVQMTRGGPAAVGRFLRGAVRGLGAGRVIIDGSRGLFRVAARRQPGWVVTTDENEGRTRCCLRTTSGR